MCGKTTGGMEECIWDCERLNFEFNSTTVESVVSSVLTGVTFKNPLCLEDCFDQDHCVTKLFEDYKVAGGVCDGAAVIEGVEDYEFAEEGTCIVFPGPEVYSNVIVKGICSEETEAALMDPKCIYDAGSRGPTYWETLWRLITLTCRSEVGLKWFNPENWLIAGRPTTKLNPVLGTINHPVFGEVGSWIPEFEHTKHRYPWICSLRSKAVGKTHFCAATLLRKPPGPTVLVTTAHCTFLCKSEDDQVRPNCCCENVSGQTCEESKECGVNPQVQKMKGEDVEVICGEWEIGDAPMVDSGEDYNVIFRVEVSLIS